MDVCTEERFLGDVTEHKMEIFRDDGVNRHLRFQKDPPSSVYRFDIITWPGHLCFTGDCGTYVFARTEDMFDFFVMDKGDFNCSEKKKLNINTGYWAEKVLSIDRHGGLEEFSSKAFENAVKHDFEQYFEPSGTEEERAKARAECWEEIEERVLSMQDNEYEARSAVDSFEHEGFVFVDFFENNLEEYTFRYLWCLYAIVWGISEYNKKKT